MFSPYSIYASIWGKSGVHLSPLQTTLCVFPTAVFWSNAHDHSNRICRPAAEVDCKWHMNFCFSSFFSLQENRRSWNDCECATAPFHFCFSATVISCRLALLEMSRFTVINLVAHLAKQPIMEGAAVIRTEPQGWLVVLLRISLRAHKQPVIE